MLQNSTHSRNQNKVRSSHVAHWLSWEMKPHTLETDVFRMSFPHYCNAYDNRKDFFGHLISAESLQNWRVKITDFHIKRSFQR